MPELKNILSDSIAKFRKAAGMTQEELGRQVGVSTQAVSKWECGGMPDPSLLPPLSEALHVSIDALFGRGNEGAADTARLVADEIRSTPQAQRFQRIYALCWAMMQANIGSSGAFGRSVENIVQGLKPVDRVTGERPETHIVVHKGAAGVEEASIASDYQYYLLMPEPQAGFSSVLRDEKSYLTLFTLLSRPNRLRMLAFLERSAYASFTVDFAAKELSIPLEEAEEALEDLCRHNFLYRIMVGTGQGEQRAYRLRTGLNLMPFFLFAGQIMGDIKESLLLFDMRTGPMLLAPLGEGNPDAAWDLQADTLFNIQIKG